MAARGTRLIGLFSRAGLPSSRAGREITYGILAVEDKDVVDLCNVFHFKANNNLMLCLRSINPSYIILIPKVDGARWISKRILNCSADTKIFTSL